MKIAAIVFVILVAVAGIGALAGCSTAKYKAPVAGQPLNSFESYAFQALNDAQAGLLDVDAKIKSGELPKALIPAYDRAAVVYNTTRDLLVRYDATLRAAGDVGSLTVEINKDLADLIALGLELFPQKTTPPAKQ